MFIVVVSETIAAFRLTHKYQICLYISIKYNKMDKNACKLIIINQPTNQHNRFINLHTFWSIYTFVIVFLFIYFHVLSFFMLLIHSYISIYYGQLLLQTKTRLVSFCVWRNFMKRHILILAFCKHDDISFFVSVRLCMLADTVGSIS